MNDSILPPPRDDRADWLRESLQTVRATRRDASTREATWSWIRLGVFALAVIGFFAAHATPVLAFGSLAVGFVLFMIARGVHIRWFEQRRHLSALDKVLYETEQRLGGARIVTRSGARPPERAAAHADPSWSLSPQEEEDLDVFAEPLGVFGLLNRTSTGPGASRLATALRFPLLDADRLERCQTAVRALDTDPRLRIELLAAAVGLRGHDDALDTFTQTVRDATPLPPWATHPMLRVWTAVALIGTATWIALIPGHWLFAPLALALANLPILTALRGKLLERLRPWLGLDVVTQSLADLATTASTTLPTDGILGDMRDAFAGAARPPALPALARRIPLLFLGYSGMLHKAINLLTLWDVHVLAALEKSYLGHRDAILAAVDTAADLEVVLSFAAFAWEEPVVCYPTVERDGACIRMTRCRHPLIRPDVVVDNDLDLALPMRVWIITGSNMSGKSTYLRAVGSALLLAQAGGVATAEAMTFTPSALMTDLRIRDDLGKEESYFLAEVRQVRRILERAESGGPILGLIDEPFRGTNSEERLGAATAVIAALIERSGFFLVATHDRQVTDLADDVVVANRHFQETLEEDTMSFDYRIRTGPATIRNAIKVLEAEGYPPAIVERARRVVRELDDARP